MEDRRNLFGKEKRCGVRIMFGGLVVLLQGFMLLEFRPLWSNMQMIESLTLIDSKSVTSKPGSESKIRLLVPWFPGSLVP